MRELAALRLGQAHDLRKELPSRRADGGVSHDVGGVQPLHGAAQQVLQARGIHARGAYGNGCVVDSSQGKCRPDARVLLAKAVGGVHHVVPARERRERASARQALGIVEIVLAVEVVRLVHVGNAVRGAEGLNQEGVVGPASARNLQEADAALAQELSSVQGSPDGRVVEHELNALSHGKGLAGRAYAPLVRAGHAGLLPVRTLKEAPVGALDHVCAAHARGLGDHAGKRAGVKVVVRLHDAHPLAASHGNAAVTGGAVALVGLVHHNDALVAGGVCVCDGR